ncbi:hypothetical protein RUM4293_04247 [Ruegeria atlantica]|uniref:Uncharacterized protein n=1 Tax=Ruegeria atlantica TaxID=81569 RepID=A0A0P1EWZ0_9RHOB|nr:hypothetical protein RUM4293_04247 [Ruegeria atlantica]
MWDMAAVAKGQTGRFLATCEHRIYGVHVVSEIIGHVGGQNRVAQHMNVIQTVHQTGEIINIAQDRRAISFGHGIEGGDGGARVGEVNAFCRAMHVIFAFTLSAGIDVKFLGSTSQDVVHQGAREA